LRSEATDVEKILWRALRERGTGYRVMRFWNGDVLKNLDGILDSIQRALTDAPTSPQPSPPPGAEREASAGG
jgi:very-short-patch-repair endonuclease